MAESYVCLEIKAAARRCLVDVAAEGAGRRCLEHCWGQPELWSVCGAERLEEWVLDVYVEGGPRVARGSTGSTLPQVQVPASSGRIRTQFGGAHGRAALMMSPSYTRPPAPSYEARHAGPSGSLLLRSCTHAVSTGVLAASASSIRRASMLVGEQHGEPTVDARTGPRGAEVPHHGRARGHRRGPIAVLRPRSRSAGRRWWRNHPAGECCA